MEISMSCINDDVFELQEMNYIINTLGQPFDIKAQ